MFTKNQIKEIKHHLSIDAIKDTQFPIAKSPLNGTEYVPIIQDAVNKIIPIANLTVTSEGAASVIKLKIESNILFLSKDGGNNWERIGIVSTDTSNLACIDSIVGPEAVSNGYKYTIKCTNGSVFPFVITKNNTIDISTYLDNYYNKNEINSKLEEINSKIGHGGADLSNYYTKEQTDNKINSGVSGYTYSKDQLDYRFNNLPLGPQKTVKSIDKYYLYSANANGVAVSSNGWVKNDKTKGALSATTPYLWRYIITVYSDNTSEITEEPNVIEFYPIANGQENVNTQFTSFVFKRSNKDLSSVSLNGGSYDNPYPNNDSTDSSTSWTDYIPNGVAVLWMAKRTFYSTASLNQNTSWSLPIKIEDTNSIDYEFSSSISDNPSIPSKTSPLDNKTYYDGWSNVSSKETVWMAMCKVINNGTEYEKKSNGVPNWQLIKVKGESGENGTSIHIKNSYLYDNFISVFKQGSSWIAPEDESDAYIVNSVPSSVWSDPKDVRDSYDGVLAVWNGTDSWVFVGQIKGADGQNGITYHMHVKYANESSVGTSVYTSAGTKKLAFTPRINGETQLGEAPGYYIGMYIDTDQEDPNNDDSNEITRYKWSKWNGEDGFGYEYIYKLTKENNRPDISSLRYDDIDDYVPDTWSDDPLTVTKNNPYCWTCYRKKVGGHWGMWIGDNGETNYARLYDSYKFNKVTSFVFKRSNDDLSSLVLTGGSFLSPIPSNDTGWTDRPQGDSSLTLWMSKATILENNTFESAWTAPQALSDSSDINIEYTSDSLNADAITLIEGSNANFGNFYTNEKTEDSAESDWRAYIKSHTVPSVTFSDNANEAKYMVVATFKNRSWQNWKVIHIGGENGAPGDPAYVINITPNTIDVNCNLLGVKDGNISQSCKATLYFGIIKANPSWSIVEQTNVNGVTLSTSDGDAVFDFSGLSFTKQTFETAYITIKAVIGGYEVGRATLNIRKIAPTQEGQPAVSHYLVTSPSAISHLLNANEDGYDEIDVNQILISAYKKVGNQAPVSLIASGTTLQEGYAIKYKIGNGIVNTIANRGTTINISKSDITLADNFISLYLYYNNVPVSEGYVIPIIRQGRSNIKDIEFINAIFSDTENSNIARVNKLLGVSRDAGSSEASIDAFINATNIGESQSDGKLMIAAGIPSNGGSLNNRSEDASFKVYESGKVVAKDVDIEGKINAKSGKVGDFTINTDISGDETGTALHSEAIRYYNDNNSKYFRSVKLGTLGQGLSYGYSNYPNRDLPPSDSRSIIIDDTGLYVGQVVGQSTINDPIARFEGVVKVDGDLVINGVKLSDVIEALRLHGIL